MPDLNDFLSTQEASEKLKYHVEQVRHMMRAGSLKGLKIGRSCLVKRDAPDSYIKPTAKLPSTVHPGISK